MRALTSWSMANVSVHDRFGGQHLTLDDTHDGDCSAARNRCSTSAWPPRRCGSICVCACRCRDEEFHIPPAFIPLKIHTHFATPPGGRCASIHITEPQNQVQEQLRHLFDVDSPFVKRNIEDLINKDYLHRLDGREPGKEGYKYVA